MANTAAATGGFRYSPTMWRVFSMSWGSGETVSAHMAPAGHRYQESVLMAWIVDGSEPDPVEPEEVA
jgi:hypothetical protein